jgi:uncharacterized protein (DUF2267 family)
MTVSPVDALNATFEKTHLWLKDLMMHGNFLDDLQAYSAFRAVLHALRDRLRVDEAAHLAAQLPMLVRGIYFEGWKPAAVPTRERTLQDFLDHVRENLGPASQIDANMATRAVFSLLDEKISFGEIRTIRQVLPPELRKLWPAGEPVTSAGTTHAALQESRHARD